MVGSFSRVELRYPNPELTDGVVRLRRWLPTDTECLRRAATDPSIPRVTTVPVLFTDEGARLFIERQRGRVESGEGVSLALADAATGEAVGNVYIAVRPQPKVVGLGYWVVPDVRGRGFAARGARLAAAWALGPLGAVRMEAWIVSDNEPSLRTVASAGFHREGVLRSFLAFGDERSDMVVWSRLATDE